MNDKNLESNTYNTTMLFCNNQKSARRLPHTFIKQLLQIFLILICSTRCNNLSEKPDNYEEQFLIQFSIFILPIFVDHCPPAEFEIKKNIEYPITLQKGNSTWFKFSPEGNVAPPEESKDYYFTVTKDTNTSVTLRSWISCRNFSSPSRDAISPFSETATEIKYKIDRYSLQFAGNNRYRLELNSENQATIIVKQN
ncbi:hypothetical protein EHR01_01610 [Leptospira mtsangambouensis]|uniref:Uncharacterized protein n=1 Tax=Leptospira mtsangambouensis TaxID=2484912 RepID=A0ABY2P335_9LEPT|nr:hypothetical protein [Leptospira mtsangambouensis]TGM81522.1 hypothetical protein EHR01_01610 [Leptospira mtsangambouensis]